MKTLKLYVGNDPTKAVVVTLSNTDLKSFAKIYGFKDELTIYGYLQKRMNREFSVLYANFEDGKYEYENFIHEIIAARPSGFHINGRLNNLYQDDFYEDVNDLFETWHTSACEYMSAEMFI